MHIKKILKSNISKVDFKNLGFGRYHSDHMLYCKYKNNNWMDPIIMPFSYLSFYPTSLVFHYGQSVFEGMKAYKDENGMVFLFRPYENFKRINKSAERLHIPKIPKNIFIEGIKKLVKLDIKWVPNCYGQSLYIRPFIIANGNFLIASPSKEYLFIVICSPCESYYEKPLKVKIEKKYSRAACNGGIGYTKSSGNYAASFYPTFIAKKEGYDQIIWTDSSTHTLIEESGTMNVFFYFKNKLITPMLNDSILSGVTRKSIIELAIKEGINVIEKKFSIKELIDAFKNNLIKEAFGCGTAVVTNIFESIGCDNKIFDLPKISNKNLISFMLKKKLLDIQHNITKDYFKWMIPILN